jgi:hypothetical protein
VSKPDEITSRMAEAMQDVGPDAILVARRSWNEGNLAKRMIEIEAGRLIKSARNTLETISPGDLLKEQGRIAGIRELLGAINALHQKANP